MTTWTTEVGSAPAYWFVRADTLSSAETVLAHSRSVPRTKVVALVGYHDDADAGTIAPRIPYGDRGEGIEEIVFCRVGPATGEVLQFDRDAWPGEDRTFVVDEVEAALALAQRFADEYGSEGSVVLVTGRPEFLAAVTELVS